MDENQGAIPQDVPATAVTPEPESQPAKPAEPPQQPLLSRAEMMKQVVASRRETVLADMDGEHRAQYEAPAAEAPEPPPAAASEPEPAPKPSQVDVQTNEPTVLADSDLGRYRVKVKVNGEERVVPLDQLRVTAQKIEAADAYLERAKQTDAEATRRAAAAPPIPTPPEAQPSQTSSGPDLVDEAIDSLFQGDEAKAKEALRKVVGRGQPATQPAVDTADIVRQVRRDTAIQDARARANKDYAHIVEDPIASNIADRYLAAELATLGVSQLRELEPEEIASVTSRALTRTDDYFASKGVARSSAPPVANTRREEKSRIDEPQAVGARAASSEPTPLTASQKIERMRAARPGQLPTG